MPTKKVFAHTAVVARNYSKGTGAEGKMALGEAIKELDLLSKTMAHKLDMREVKAVKLGIEALKFFKDLEDRGALPADVRLPGETVEEE